MPAFFILIRNISGTVLLIFLFVFKPQKNKRLMPNWLFCGKACTEWKRCFFKPAESLIDATSPSWLMLRYAPALQMFDWTSEVGHWFYGQVPSHPGTSTTPLFNLSVLFTIQLFNYFFCSVGPNINGTIESRSSHKSETPWRRIWKPQHQINNMQSEIHCTTMYACARGACT